MQERGGAGGLAWSGGAPGRWRRLACALAGALSLGAPGAARAEPPWVAPTELVKLIVEELSGADPAKAKPGEARRVAYVIEHKAPKALGEELREALTAEGLRLIDEVYQVEQAALTVEATNGARALVRLEGRYGEIFVIAKPSATKAPGACAAIPSRAHEVYVHALAIRQDGELGESSKLWRLSTRRLVDVDGDAILDALVPVYKEGQCPEEGFWTVYAVRGRCGHLLGQVGPGLLEPGAITIPLDASGFRPLSFASELRDLGPRGLPLIVTTTTGFAVSKGRYKQTKRERHEGECHHCATTWCSAP